MKVHVINFFNQYFTGQRKDRNTVSQLTENNPYDLNVPNQRRISQAIDNLGEVAGEDNINFLIEANKNLKYGTGIDLGKQPYNDWKLKLTNAVKKSYALSDSKTRQKLSKKVQEILTDSSKPLSDCEKSILDERKKLFSKIDYDELNKIKNKNIRNLENNLDYFVISSEVATEQKLYILKRLNYFMSDDYEINPQLSDKKTQALAEIINDITINNPQTEVPNIKSVNQCRHGICAAISIARKALAYEDKANYVDTVLSEIDSSPELMVYDINNLGSHTRVPVKKTPIDYKYALEKGYRIVDTASMNWMHVADTAGSNNEFIGVYNAFDRENFDNFSDSHLNVNISDELSAKQDSYRTLIKAKSVIANRKADLEKEKFLSSAPSAKTDKIGAYSKELKNIIRLISPQLSPDEINVICTDLLSLENSNSQKEKRVMDFRADFVYLPNEEESIKSEKIKNYLMLVLPDAKNSKILDKNLPIILDLVTDINSLNKNDSSSLSQKMRTAKSIYRAAAAYRTEQLSRTRIPDYLHEDMLDYDIPDSESIVLNNMKELSAKLRKGKINPELQAMLAYNFDVPNDNISIAAAIDDNRNTLEYLLTGATDDLYQLMLAGDAKELLVTKIRAIIDGVKKEKDKEYLSLLAEDLVAKNHKNSIYAKLKMCIDIVKSRDCSFETYAAIQNIVNDYSKYYKDLSLIRKNVLASEIEFMLNRLDEPEYGKATINNIAKDLRVKPDKNVVKKCLINCIEKLHDPQCSEEQYVDILNKTGHKSRLYDFKLSFESLGQIMFKDNNQEMIKMFNTSNGLLPDASREETIEKYRQIGEQFNKISVVFSMYSNALNIDDKNGKVLNSISTPYLLIKKMEDNGIVPSEDELRLLQNRFNLIEKALAEDANSSYKDLPKHLTAFTPREKDILKKYDKNINKWHSTTVRRLNETYREIRKPLEELNRQIGVKSGERWVRGEGDSGLLAKQQVKIFEHMTDRPYYIESDGHTAVEKIKNSPYSGISSTSVLHTEPAAHAQYIADVASVKTKDGEIKEAIFHDNSWGAIEHKNVWTDKDGLKRTDYENKYGGEQGYITNQNYYNGKLTENLLDKAGQIKPEEIESKAYKKLRGNQEEYKFPMFFDVITSGVHPNVESEVESIRLNTLILPDAFIDDLEKYAKKMTTAELKKKMFKIEMSSDDIYKKYDELIKRIEGDKILNKGIKTREDYNKLKENDPLRIFLEKTAIIKSYDNISNGSLRKFYGINNQKGLDELRSVINASARKDFNYVFAKDKDFIKYSVENSRQRIYDEITEFAKENGIKISVDDKIYSVSSMKNIPDREFDGSLDKTVNLAVDEFKKYFIKNTRKFADKNEKTEILAQNIGKILHDNLYVTENDVKKYFSDYKMQHIANWIDYNFKPKDNKEFARILNNLRAMKTEEFNKKYSSMINDESLGIKNIDGFDILTAINAQNYKMQDQLFYRIYELERSKYFDYSETKPEYDYKKFARKLQGAVYAKGRTFDDIYEDYYYSLWLLNLGEKYNKFKYQAFKDYGAFPAYPVISYKKEEGQDKLLDRLSSDLDDDILAIWAYKNQQITFNLIHDIFKIIDGAKNSELLTKRQKSVLDKDLKEIIHFNSDDETMIIHLDNIKKLLDENSYNTADYKKLVQSIYDDIKIYETTSDGSQMAAAIRNKKLSIDHTKTEFVYNTIEFKYQKKALELLNKYVALRSRAKNEKDEDKRLREAEIVFEQFKKFCNKHYIFNTPEKILQDFLLMSAKDAKPQDLHGNETGDRAVDILKDFRETKWARKESIKSLLYSANILELQFILMDCARNGNLNVVKDAFKNSKFQLSDGSYVPLDSVKALNLILSPLIYNSEIETALMFINQLGVGEKAVEMLTNDIAMKRPRKTLNQIHSIFRKVSKQAQYANEASEKFKGIDSDPDWEKRVEEIKQELINKIKSTKYSKTVEIYEKGFDIAIEHIRNNPNTSKYNALTLNLEAASHASVHVAQKNAENLNEILAFYGRIYNILENIQIPPNSPLNKRREEFMQAYRKFLDYQDSIAKYYENIGVGIDKFQN